MTKKFSLDGIDKTAHDITTYVQESMKAAGCGQIEIEEYVQQAKKEDIGGLISLSQEYIDMINSWDPSEQECKVTYLW